MRYQEQIESVLRRNIAIENTSAMSLADQAARADAADAEGRRRTCASYMIALFKTTPYLAIVGVKEMLGTAFDQALDFRYLEPMSVLEFYFQPAV
ncbi:hypothetical protein [Bosea sp. TAF32]|uniref:hypothetical protein n=1 Tax=Bosea sp. TAF32 TaxID=3237482 RepID=UPI003F8E5F1D